MKSTALTLDSYRVVSNHTIAEILENEVTGEKSFHSIVAFKAGDVVHQFSGGKTMLTPTYLTVQTGERRHITLNPEFLQYINHSCNPNVFFNTTTFEVTALKDIEPGDELTFFYPSTEWDMVQPFACLCGSKNCLQNIQGAKYLSKEVIQQYKITDFIQRMLSK